MRVLCTVLLSCLAACLIDEPAPAHSDSQALSQHRAPSPVVIEWFAHPTASVGQREVVYVRLLDRNRPLAGARLGAHIQRGKRTLMVLHGSTTDRTGKASASFIVPASARGKLLRVIVSLVYQRYRFPGRNDLTVRG